MWVKERGESMNAVQTTNKGGSAMRKVTIYEILFRDATNTWQRSRICQTIRGAKHWAKWLEKQAFCIEVAIYKGGAGAERVY
jgi:hypothetical protein